MKTIKVTDFASSSPNLLPKKKLTLVFNFFFLAKNTYRKTHFIFVNREKMSRTNNQISFNRHDMQCTSTDRQKSTQFLSSSLHLHRPGSGTARHACKL